MSDADDFIAYLRGLSVPRNMVNCQGLVDYVISQVGNRPRTEAEHLQQLGKTVTRLTAAVLELINGMETVERVLEKRG